MSAAQDALDALGVRNGHDVAKRARERGLPDIYIGYRPAETMGVYHGPAWQVHRPGYQTDPGDRYWRNYGNKTFNVHGRAHRAPALEQAKAWAADRYGITEWGTIPGLPGDVFPADVAAMVRADLKAAKRAAKETT